MTDTVAIAPLAFGIADAEALDDWMRRAAAGDRFVLARGRVRPTFAPVWLAAAMAEKAGLLTVVAVADGAAGQWCWQAEWCAAPAGGAGGAREDARETLRRADGMRSAAEPRTSGGELVTEVILRLCRRAANLGTGAPSLRELAKQCELNSPQAARHWLVKLVGRGRLRIEDRNDMTHGLRRRIWVSEPNGRERATGWSPLTGQAK